jgi:DNA-binding NtrC family response regulator
MLEEPHQLEVYGSLLSEKGYEALTCSSPREGMNFLEAKAISMVIVSQGTPAFEGRPMLERSMQIHPAVPVLVVARIANMRCYLEAMNLGASDYFEFPDPPDLARAVDMQMLRSALAGAVEWDRLFPILKSRRRDRDEKPPTAGRRQPLPRWGTPKFPQSKSSLSQQESVRLFRMKTLRKAERDIPN